MTEMIKNESSGWDENEKIRKLISESYKKHVIYSKS